MKVPVVSFGAWAIGGWMWGGTDDAAAIKAIQTAIDCGITCIDTAPIYGMGHSETVVGKAIAGRRDGLVIATKCGVRWDTDKGRKSIESQMPDGRPVDIHRYLGPDSILRECEQSLQRLGVDVIDLYQCHWPDPTTPIGDTMDALLKLRDQGKIRAIGVSNFTPELMDECLDYAPLASNQPPYNPLQRDIEADVVPFCLEHNIGLLAYSPIAQGLMTGKVTMDREFPEDDVRSKRPWFKRENRRRVLDALAQIQPIADGHGATLAQVAIQWVVSQPGITSALVGARNPQQASENAKAADIQLTGEELGLIRELVEGLGEPDQTDNPRRN